MHGIPQLHITLLLIITHVHISINTKSKQWRGEYQTPVIVYYINNGHMKSNDFRINIFAMCKVINKQDWHLHEVILRTLEDGCIVICLPVQEAKKVQNEVPVSEPARISTSWKGATRSKTENLKSHSNYLNYVCCNAFMNPLNRLFVSSCSVVHKHESTQEQASK